MDTSNASPGFSPDQATAPGAIRHPTQARRLAAILVTLAACGDPGAAGPDARPDAPPGCTRPSLDAPWLRPFLADLLAQLAAAPRASSTERDAARQLIAAQLTALGAAPALQSYPGGINVHATLPLTLPGPDPRAIVVGAHLDTVTGSPGADDNASGVAVVLAVARFLSDVPCRTAPVTLALFDQEEVGLLGARAFATSLDPAAVRAVHTIDQVAWDADGDRRFELELPTPALEAEWRAAAALTGASLTTTSTTGTDHAAFRALGFAAAGLTEEYAGGDASPFQHLPGDTPASVAPYLDSLVLAAQLTAQVVLDEAAP